MACFIPEGTGRWMGPNAIPKKGPALRQETEGLSRWVLNTFMRERALGSFSYQGVYCIYVWRPSAGVPIGSVSLQVSRCWGVWGRSEWYWLSDLRTRLWSRPKKCIAQHDMHPACAAAPPPRPPAPSSEVRCRSSPAAAAERHVGWI